MAGQRRFRKGRTAVLVVFFVGAAAVYFGISMLMGSPSVSAVISSLVWAAIFVPGMLWVNTKMNTRLANKTSSSTGADDREEHASELTGEARSDERSSVVVGHRDGGGFYRRTSVVPWVDPARAAVHLTEVSAWRTTGQPDDDTASLRHGSRAWLRIMGGWDWTPRSRSRWPFAAQLVGDQEGDTLEVTVTDNFGRWLDLDSSSGSAGTRMGAHGDVLLAEILDRLKELSTRS